MHSRSLVSSLAVLALLASAPSGIGVAAPPPAIATYRVVEVDAFSAPALPRAGPEQVQVALVAAIARLVLTNPESERVAPVESLDLFMADEPTRRQVSKPDPGSGIYLDSTSLASVRHSDRWRLNLGDHDRIPLRI